MVDGYYDKNLKVLMDDGSPSFEALCEKLDLNPKDSALLWSTRLEDYKSNDGYAVIHPEKNIVESILPLALDNERLYVFDMKTVHRLGCNFQDRDDLNPDEDLSIYRGSISILPASWAREEFTREGSTLLNDMLGQRIVRDFLFEAKAVPDAEKDPVGFGLGLGVMESLASKDEGKSLSDEQLEKRLQQMAKRLSVFNLQKFQKYCEKNGFEISPKHTDADPYCTASFLADAVKQYLPTLSATRTSSLSEGFHKVLCDTDGKKMLQTLGNAMKGDKRALDEVKRLAGNAR